MATATLLGNLHIIQSTSFRSLYRRRGQVLHLISLTFCPAILLNLLQVHGIAIRKPGVIASPASDRDQHLYSTPS